MMRLRPPGTLRGRLAGAMAVIFIMAVAVSALVNRLQPGPVLSTVASPVLHDALDYEPYQDAFVLAVFGIPALLLIWLISSWSLRPLVRASAEARRVGPADPDARISRAGMPAEIIPLIDAVNGALNRMADAFEAERHFTENAAHELRTPLAVLSLRLQRARQTRESIDWPSIDRDVAQMNRLVSQLLELARKQNAGRTHVPTSSLNLARVAREACAMVLPLAEAQGRALRIELPDMLPVAGDADDLRDALRNLLENAVLHGAGEIGVAAIYRDGGVLVAVTDQGAGVQKGQEEAVFDRFRKDRASAGTGLGLAIVREVARRHGGRVGFVPGDVCRVEFWLPGGEANKAGFG